MLALIVKWGFVLALVVVVVIALYAPTVRKPLFALAKRYAIPAIAVVVIFSLIIFIAHIGT